MKIGLYFGSFNPIHQGHLIIAETVLNESGLDQVWLVVSPQNPFKPAASLLNEYERLHLVQLAIEGEEKLKASDIEFHLPKPSYTIDTLTYISEKYPKHTFTLIVGGDSIQNMPKWKNADVLMQNYPILVFNRPGFETGSYPNNITFVEAPLLEISSTYIRKLIKQGKSIRFLTPDKVVEEIEKNRLYL